MLAIFRSMTVSLDFSPRSASFTTVQQAPQTSEEEEERYRSRPSDLIRLWLDLRSLSEHLRGPLLEKTVLPALGEEDLSEHQAQVIRAGMEEGCAGLDTRLDSLSDLVVRHVAGRCLPYLRQVSDIPRLYRRTNRGVPSRPCAYVSTAMAPAADFRREQAALCGGEETVVAEAVRGWMVRVFQSVAAQFLANVSEVLAAVQKMEESLRRLKRVSRSKVYSYQGWKFHQKLPLASSLALIV